MAVRQATPEEKAEAFAILGCEYRLPVKVEFLQPGMVIEVPLKFSTSESSVEWLDDDQSFRFAVRKGYRPRGICHVFAKTPVTGSPGFYEVSLGSVAEQSPSLTNHVDHPFTADEEVLLVAHNRHTAIMTLLTGKHVTPAQAISAPAGSPTL